MTPIEWMTTAEVSAYLGITARTLYRLIDEGQIVAYRFGRVLRLKQTDVESYIESVRVTPGSLQHLRAPARPRLELIG